MADGFAQESRLARFRLDHEQAQGRDRNLQRDGRRAAARADVEQARVGAKVRAVPPGALEVARGNERFDEQPVDGLIWRVVQRERGEIDLLVPEFEEPVVSAERLGGLRIKGDVRPPGPLRQPLAEFPWRHG